MICTVLLPGVLIGHLEVPWQRAFAADVANSLLNKPTWVSL